MRIATATGASCFRISAITGRQSNGGLGFLRMGFLLLLVPSWCGHDAGGLQHVFRIGSGRLRALSVYLFRKSSCGFAAMDGLPVVTTTEVA